MEEWKVGRRRPGCSKCDREFASEETHYSCIFEREERFERGDFCLSCWESGEVAPFSHWKTRTPKRVERRLEDIEAMSEFFNALCRDDQPGPLRRKVIYLVSLLLMRKRRLKLVGREEDLLVLERARDGVQVRIADPWIEDSELESLREDMERLFAAQEDPAHAGS